jgi:hypothetical protein
MKIDTTQLTDVECLARDLEQDPHSCGVYSEPDEYCERCEQFDEVHGPQCPEHPDHDPTPWCSACGARRQADCQCPPIARNE